MSIGQRRESSSIIDYFINPTICRLQFTSVTTFLRGITLGDSRVSSLSSFSNENNDEQLPIGG
jgi:SET domain-containing protein